MICLKFITFWVLKQPDNVLSTNLNKL